MWVKYLIIAVLFYIFAILQNSFLVHFNILGITPKLILIFYFLLIFFSARGGPAFGWENSFYAIIAGFLLDVFSRSHFGVSIISLLITMFLIKKVLLMLWERSDKYSVIYFISLFIFYLIFYKVILNVSMPFLNPGFADFNLNWGALIAGAYNLLFAIIGFYVFGKFNILGNENRQLKLF